MFQKMMLSIVGVSAIAACLLSSGASYAGATASSGYAVPYADQTCFVVTGGAVQNVCAGDRSWTVTDYIQVTGSHAVQVTGRRPNGTTTFTCATCATTREGGLVSCNPASAVVPVNVNTTLNLGTVNVPAFGSLVVSCLVGPNAVFGSASF